MAGKRVRSSTKAPDFESYSILLELQWRISITTLTSSRALSPTGTSVRFMRIGTESATTICLQHRTPRPGQQLGHSNRRIWGCRRRYGIGVDQCLNVEVFAFRRLTINDQFATGDCDYPIFRHPVLSVQAHLNCCIALNASVCCLNGQ